MRLIDADELFESFSEMHVRANLRHGELLLQGNIAMSERAAQAISTLLECMFLVNNQETVDARIVRYGEWIKTDRGFSCSMCCKERPHRTEFCPRCGAEMDFTKRSEQTR